MHSLPPMVDMRRTPAEKQDAGMTAMCSPSEYPYGLSISLDNDCLEKLKADFDSIEIGESYHLFVMAKVTAKSRNESESGPCDRVELQITHMAAESEDAENADDEPLSKKLYKKK